MPAVREQGTAFGSYVLLKRLARGGMAEVFLARQRGPEGFDRQVAVKRILPHLADSADFITQFQDEARLAARLSHPNVVHIYEFGKVGDHYFIAMEYVDGVHAGALIEHGAIERMPPALVARIGADACAGLSYAHRLSDASGRLLHLVHRDISPPNLMISYDGVVKLVDFGIAKAVDMMDKTRPGIVKGKFAYMSPEQTMGKRLDGRSDVFSLALVCWELLAGRVAVDRTDPVEAMKCIRDGKVPSIQKVRPDTPPPLAHILEQALRLRPTERLSASDFGNALEGYIKSSPELGTSMQLSEWVRTRLHQVHAGSSPPYDPAADLAPVERRRGGAMDSPHGGASQSDASFRRGGARPPSSLAPGEPRRAPTRPAAAGEIGSGAAPPGGGAPAFDPKASFLQDVDDDDALTQITSQPTHPAQDPPHPQRAGLPPPRPAMPSGSGPTTLPPTTLPPTTLPPPMSGSNPSMSGSNPSMAIGSNPSMAPGQSLSMAPVPMPADNAWARFTGAAFLLHTRRRRIIIAAVATAVLLLVIALAMTSDEAAPQPESKRDDVVGVAADAGSDPGGRRAAADDRADSGTDRSSAAGAERAWLEVITRPKGALVTLDDRDPMESPAIFEDLEAGEHTIAIEHEGYRDIEQTVELEPGVKTLEFNLEKEASRPRAAPTGALNVVTRPSSQVYMGKRRLDTTPFANKRLKPGTYTLTFKKPGYQTVTRKVTIRAGETTKLNFALPKR
jgi:eukaryotic-like serine/threonine-protein kinase